MITKVQLDYNKICEDFAYTKLNNKKPRNYLELYDGLVPSLFKKECEKGYITISSPKDFCGNDIDEYYISEDNFGCLPMYLPKKWIKKIINKEENTKL